MVYLSTGPWNVAPALERFLAPTATRPGPLLLTDWGPTAQAWFRSGQEHKRRQLRRLLGDLPRLQLDPRRRRRAARPRPVRRGVREFPGRVDAVVIRQLSPLEQVLTHGVPEPPAGPEEPGATEPREAPGTPPQVTAPDGVQLLAQLRRRGLLPGAPAWP